MGLVIRKMEVALSYSGCSYRFLVPHVVYLGPAWDRHSPGTWPDAGLAVLA